MSFSSEVKEELSQFIPSARHCCIAELGAMISDLGKITQNKAGELELNLSFDSLQIAGKCFTLFKKTYNIDSDIGIKGSNAVGRKNQYSLRVVGDRNVKRVLEGTKLVVGEYGIGDILSVQDNMIVKNTCCKRAFIRGAFLATGSVSNPKKAYHFEIIFSDKVNAIFLKEMMRTLDLSAKIVQRKKTYVVYLKESEQIVKVLGIMEASSALMNFENERIFKEVRNVVNRKVNCETANLGKTISASYKQIKDITLIRECLGLDSLPESLKEIAHARLEDPDASLRELGERLHPPLGKSGVNHRLRKLSEIANSIGDTFAL